MDSLIKVLLERDLLEDFFIGFKDGKQLCENHMINRLVYNRIIFVQKGSGTVHIDDMNYDLADDQLFLISKGQLLSFGLDTVFKGFTLSFGDGFWQKSPSSANNCKAVLFNNASNNQLLPLSATDRTELDFLFDALYQEFIKPGYVNKPDALAAYLKIIMIKVANVNASLAKGFDSYDKQQYRKFLELISVNYQSSHEVSTYTKKMGISARKLTDLSKRYSGKGAKDLINGQLIAEAKDIFNFLPSL